MERVRTGRAFHASPLRYVAHRNRNEAAGARDRKRQALRMRLRRVRVSIGLVAPHGEAV